MKKQTVEALAQSDAKRWMLAEMFYGEGAGTRRKLLNAEIEDKMAKMPGYLDTFQHFYDTLDKNKYAQMAIKERKAIDRANTASKNFRALKSGNLRGLSNGVFLAAGVVYVAHVTGYDKVVIAEAKKQYKNATLKYAQWRHSRTNQFPKGV